MTRDHIVSMRVTGEEREQLKARADSLGIDLSELLRRAAFNILNPPRELNRESCTIGTPVNQGATVIWHHPATGYGATATLSAISPR